MLKPILIKICLAYLMKEALSTRKIINNLHTQDVDKTVDHNIYLESIDDIRNEEFIDTTSTQDLVDSLDTLANCNETNVCKNGGSCLRHYCLCLPGTSGSFCEIIDDCEYEKLCEKDENTLCMYSVEDQKAYCHCRVMEYRFDEATRTCRDCLCTPTFSQVPSSFSYCEYKQGQQICTCTEGYAPIYNPYEGAVICKSCNCGPHSTWCEFKSLFSIACSCQEGYVEYYESCKECNCGKHGRCSLSGSRNKECYCDSGYEEYNLTCVECNCGKYGKCIFDFDGKQTGCECIPGYAEKSGKCEICQCGENSNCSFTGNTKICECQDGFQNVNGFCTDINECEKHNPCWASTRCVNTLGSFECICDKGYEWNSETLLCKDVDECKFPSTCSQRNTKCINTIGSFKCICESDFVARGGSDSNIFCERSSEKAIYTLWISVFIVGIILAYAVIWHQRSYFRRR